MLAERPAQGKGKKQESALVGPGSVLGAAAFLSSTRSRAAVRAAGTCRLAAFGPQELEALLVSALLVNNLRSVKGHVLYILYYFVVLLFLLFVSQETVAHNTFFCLCCSK